MIFLLGYFFRHFEYKRIFIGSIIIFEIGKCRLWCSTIYECFNSWACNWWDRRRWDLSRVNSYPPRPNLKLQCALLTNCRALNYVTVIASRKEGVILNALMGL